MTTHQIAYRYGPYVITRCHLDTKFNRDVHVAFHATCEECATMPFPPAPKVKK